MLEILYFMSVIAIPFNGVKGIGAFGEMSHELSVYPFLVVIALVVAATFLSPRKAAGDVAVNNGSPLFYVFGGIVLLVVLSIIMNVSQVAISNFHERSGFNKFSASTLVIIYGMGLAYATYKLVPGRWQSLIIFPTAISVILCLIYSFFEILSHMGILVPVFKSLNAIVHTSSTDLLLKWNGKVNLNRLEGWDKRIRSLCFEAPAFGNFTGFSWPWILAGFMSNKGAARRFYGVVLVLFTALIVVAQARTGWIMLTCNLFILGVLRYIYLVPVPGRYDKRLGNALIAGIAVLFVSAAGYYLYDFQAIVQKVIRGDSVSNLSRLASQVAAVNIFKDHLLMGVGFGQYGFYVTQYMPEWGYLSYELRPWLIYPTAPWPAVYSMYARLAAEMGIVGLTAWVGLWLFMAYQIVEKSRQFLNLHGKLPVMAYPLVMCYFCILVSSVTTDTLRTPMIWISLGLGCAYLNGLPLQKKAPVADVS